MPLGDCCKLAHYATSVGEHNSTMAALRLRALGSMHQRCKPSAPTLAHPQPKPLLYQEAPTVTALPFLYCLLIGC